VAGSSTDNPLVTGAVADYQAWVTEQVDETIAATKTFTDAVRAGDLESAKAPARHHDDFREGPLGTAPAPAV